MRLAHDKPAANERAVISEIDPSGRKGHVSRFIRAGDRQDVLLRRLAIDATGTEVNWTKKNPAYYEHRWVRAEELDNALAGHGHKTRALSTLISLGCRVHMEARWPGWTIENDQKVIDGKRVSLYRLGPRGALGPQSIVSDGGAATPATSRPTSLRACSPEGRDGRPSRPARQATLFRTGAWR